MQALERTESARTVEVLRAASDRTALGDEMLRIAEAEEGGATVSTGASVASPANFAAQMGGRGPDVVVPKWELGAAANGVATNAPDVVVPKWDLSAGANAKMKAKTNVESSTTVLESATSDDEYDAAAKRLSRYGS